MHTPEQRTALIADIRALPEALAAAVEDWSDAQLDFRPSKDEWSARQIVHHVADSHMNSFMRMKLALSEDTPTIKPYDQEVWAEMVDTTGPPIVNSLDLLRGLHARWVALWESLSEEDYLRTYYHPENDAYTSLDEHLAIYSKHSRDHVEQIARIAREQGW
ncbi:MAG: putative metal-dependent hydrolase [Anaerolineae bacterium]|nr:putative metal-dependent hydrolase [Anaerolineae bacterium]